MKKISISLAIILFISMLVNTCVMAYSTEDFSIDIPESYEEKDTDSFTDEEGRNINVKIGDYGVTLSDEMYSEETLQNFVDAIYESMDETREDIKDTLRAQNTQLTEEEINAYVDTFKIEEVIKKEITTFSKNNYKALHIVTKYQFGEKHSVMDQYQVITATKAYTLTVSSLSLEEYYSNRNQEIIDSFTINNFEAPESNETNTTATTSNDSNKNLIVEIAVPIVIAAVGGIIGFIFRGRRR